MKHCIDCGKEKLNACGLRCTVCANLRKAKIADGRCKESREPRLIKMKNGLTILNNVFGKELARNSEYLHY